MDVIPSTALNQYLITDTDKRLECESVCDCESKEQTGSSWDRVTASHFTCVTACMGV